MYVLFVVLCTFASLKLISYFDVPYKTIISPVIIMITVIYLIMLVVIERKDDTKN